MNDPYSYNPAVFFDSFYAASSRQKEGPLTDAQTVGDLSARFIRFHYNSLENLIMESLGDNLPLAVLDFGAGAGHWTDFAIDALQATALHQVEISTRAFDHLVETYGSNPRVEFFNLKTLDYQYDAIFAIGVMFHIVRDELWESTLRTLIARLKPDGYLFCSGSFVGETRDVQFHVADAFDNWDNCYVKMWTQPESIKVHKRLRSFEDWRAAVENNGGVIETRWFNRAPEGYVTPENNLLVIRRRRKE